LQVVRSFTMAPSMRSDQRELAVPGHPAFASKKEKSFYWTLAAMLASLFIAAKHGSFNLAGLFMKGVIARGKTK